MDYIKKIDRLQKFNGMSKPLFFHDTDDEYVRLVQEGRPAEKV